MTSCAAAKFPLGLLNRRILHDAQAQEIAALGKDLLAQAIGQSRSLAHELRPPALSQGDLRVVHTQVRAAIRRADRVKSLTGILSARPDMSTKYVAKL